MKRILGSLFVIFFVLSQTSQADRSIIGLWWRSLAA